ncbi:MAG: RNA polymerase sigma factor [Phycisphaerae bacterium]|nr:RNA polymerase sigma factor [Phycisphaerae bacterium]
MVMAHGVTNALEQMAERQDKADAVLAGQRDPVAFENLVAVHGEHINRLVYRLLGWSHDAEDVSQEVFLAALKNLKKFRGQSSLSTWLTRIAVNKARSHRRKLRSRIRALRAAARMSRPTAESKPESASADREVFRRVRQAVQALPSRYREVVVMRYLEQMPTAEVVKVLGISRSAMDARLHRARRRLKEVLGDLVSE